MGRDDVGGVFAVPLSRAHALDLGVHTGLLAQVGDGRDVGQAWVTLASVGWRVRLGGVLSLGPRLGAGVAAPLTGASAVRPVATFSLGVELAL